MPCAQCASVFKPKSALAMYCSKACKRLAWNKAKDPAYGTKRISVKTRAQAKRDSTSAARIAQREAKLAAKLAAKQAELEMALAARRKVCAQCGTSFEAISSLAKWCSDPCRKAAPAFRLQKRIGKQTRRARLRNVECERFADVEVFERDGWRCQICGVLTPERLVGSNNPSAPTIDHIVALANGGPHTRANVQCACRACNSRKSDGPARGQLGLFAGIEGGSAQGLGSIAS